MSAQYLGPSPRKILCRWLLLATFDPHHYQPRHQPHLYVWVSWNKTKGATRSQTKLNDRQKDRQTDTGSSWGPLGFINNLLRSFFIIFSHQHEVQKQRLCEMRSFVWSECNWYLNIHKYFLTELLEGFQGLEQQIAYWTVNSLFISLYCSWVMLMAMYSLCMYCILSFHWFTSVILALLLWNCFWPSYQSQRILKF